MRYRVEWLADTIGLLHCVKEEDEVKEFVECLVTLGFTPDVKIEE